MRTSKQVEVKTKLITVSCDDCGKDQIPDPYSFGLFHKCSFCGKDLCLDCTIEDWRDSFGGDYPNGYYCKSCWDAGEKHRKLEEEEEERHDTVIELLNKEWKFDALAKQGKT